MNCGFSVERLLYNTLWFQTQQLVPSRPLVFQQSDVMGGSSSSQSSKTLLVVDDTLSELTVHMLHTTCPVSLENDCSIMFFLTFTYTVFLFMHQIVFFFKPDDFYVLFCCRCEALCNMDFGFKNAIIMLNIITLCQRN